MDGRVGAFGVHFSLDLVLISEQFFILLFIVYEANALLVSRPSSRRPFDSLIPLFSWSLSSPPPIDGAAAVVVAAAELPSMNDSMIRTPALFTREGKISRDPCEM